MFGGAEGIETGISLDITSVYIRKSVAVYDQANHGHVDRIFPISFDSTITVAYLNYTFHQIRLKPASATLGPCTMDGWPKSNTPYVESRRSLCSYVRGSSATQCCCVSFPKYSGPIRCERLVSSPMCCRPKCR
jgi:hypothetical protein